MVNIAFDTRGRTQLFWNTELANKIREDFNDVFIDFCNGKTPFVIPKMKFTKYNEMETVVLMLKVDKQRRQKPVNKGFLRTMVGLDKLPGLIVGLISILWKQVKGQKSVGVGCLI